MADNDYLPVAELYARLVLDSSGLAEGLQNARIKLADISPSIMGAQKALDSFAKAGKLSADDQAAAADEIQRSWMLRKRALEDEDMARKRYATTWGILLRQQEEAQRTMNAITAQQIAMSPMGRYIAEVQAGVGATERLGNATQRVTDVSFANYRKVNAQLGAMNEMMGTKIPGALLRMLSFAPIVQEAMNAMFQVEQVAAFAAAIVYVVEKIDSLVYAAEGFDKASLKMWENARNGAEATSRELISIRDKELDVILAGKKGSDKAQWGELVDSAKIDERNKHLRETGEQLRKMADIITKLDKMGASDNWLSTITKSVPDLVKLNKEMQQIKDMGITYEQYKDLYEKRKKEFDSLSGERYGLQLDQKKKEREAAAAHDTHHKRHIPGAELHEESNRLPGYQGVNPAQNFRSQMGGKYPTGGGGSNTSKPVTVHSSYQPIFHFEGVPADVEKFLRDKLGPAMVQDLKSNTRGLATQIIRAIKESGQAVPVG